VAIKELFDLETVMEMATVRGTSSRRRGTLHPPPYTLHPPPSTLHPPAGFPRRSTGARKAVLWRVDWPRTEQRARATSRWYDIEREKPQDGAGPRRRAETCRAIA